MVGDGLPDFTVVGAASCPIPDWLAPLQARNSPATRKIPKPVARVGCIISLLLIAVLNYRNIIFKRPNNNKNLRILSLILN